MACILASGLNNWPKITKQNAQISTVAVSPGLLCVGFSSGDVHLYYITQSQHISLHWAKKIHHTKSVEHIAINPEETFLVVAGKGALESRGKNAAGALVILDLLSGDVCLETNFETPVSSVGWVGKSLYIGERSGSVHLVEVEEENISPMKQILDLDSEVVQIDGKDDLLACSTLTRAVVCNHRNKTYREIGSKLRNSTQGVAVHKGRVWAARPGCRIWEVDMVTGNVLSTRQFRKVISERKTDTIQGQDGGKQTDIAQGQSVGRQEDVVQGQCIGRQTDVARGQSVGRQTEELKRTEHNFTLLQSTDDLIISYNERGMIYILNMDASSVVAWTQLSCNIRHLCVSGNLILVLDCLGDLHHISFGTLDILLESAYKIDQFERCADILINNRKLIRTLTKEHIEKIIRINDLSYKLADPNKANKIYKLMDAIERLGISLGGRRHENRSISQDRRQGAHSSTELLLKDEMKSGKSQSQEDLLDGRKRRTTFNRTLSGSTKSLSASEQGLQALQLYNIKFGNRDRSSLSGTSSYKSSAESVYGSRSMLKNGSTEGLDEAAVKLREKLEEQARDAGIYMNIDSKRRIVEENKLPEYKPTDYSRISEYEFGEGPVIMSMEDTNIFGDALAGMEKLLEGSKLLDGGAAVTKLSNGAISKLLEGGGGLPKLSDSGGAVSKLLERREGEERQRFGLSDRLNETLKVATLQKKFQEFSRLCEQVIINEEYRSANTKSLANLLLEIHMDFRKEDDNGDTENSKRLDFCQNLNELQRNYVKQALTVILSSPELTRLLMVPLQEVCPSSPAPDYIYQQLVSIFDQDYIDFDCFVAETLESFSELLTCDTLMETMQVTSYYTYKFIISVDESRRPNLSPIRLEQIDDENVFSCSNFLSSYQDLSTIDLVRYIGTILRLNSECSLHIIQSQAVHLPPSCLLFITFQYYQLLMASIASQDCSTLMPQLESEWITYLCRALSVHIPGWPKEWSEICKQHSNFLQFILSAFTSNNLAYLNKYPTIKGSHKSLENLELSPLANFLMKEIGLTSVQEKLTWCKKNSFMPGLVRCLLLEKESAPLEMPLLIELGDSELLYDVGLLTADQSPSLSEHILKVYSKDECPLNWDEFSRFLLKGSGGSVSLIVLLKLSSLMEAGDLSSEMYAELLLKALLEKSRC